MRPANDKLARLRGLMWSRAYYASYSTSFPGMRFISPVISDSVAENDYQICPKLHFINNFSRSVIPEYCLFNIEYSLIRCSGDIKSKLLNIYWCNLESQKWAYIFGARRIKYVSSFHCKDNLIILSESPHLTGSQKFLRCENAINMSLLIISTD